MDFALPNCYIREVQPPQGASRVWPKACDCPCAPSRATQPPTASCSAHPTHPTGQSALIDWLFYWSRAALNLNGQHPTCCRHSAPLPHLRRSYSISNFKAKFLSVNIVSWWLGKHIFTHTVHDSRCSEVPLVFSHLCQALALHSAEKVGLSRT